MASRTFSEFRRDECTDLAAALTYFAVLSLFPALIALLSLLSLAGQGTETVDAIVNIVSNVGGRSVADSVRPTLVSLSQTPGAGLALVLGLSVSLWTASGYVGAFGRAMNRICGVAESRPIWKRRPVLLLVTFVMVILVAAAALILVVSGPVATAVGQQFGLGSTTVTVWGILKWPVLLVIVMFVVAFMYYSTPNVQQPRFKWLSPGAIVATLAWVVASILFGFYVANFSSYDKTYGSLAGVIVFLLWLWITNLALLFGAELDAELERDRQLQGE
ncbi:MAG: YihY/virulence factor BrkB family protein [Actinomycetes bacterium]